MSAQREEEQMARTNGAIVTDLTAVKKCIKEIEECLDEIASLKGSYMKDCKEVRDEMASIFMRAKDKGVNIRAVKTLIATRLMQDTIDRKVGDLDIDQLATYRQYAEAAEAWSTTPLAKAVKEPQPEVAQ
jgi:uncharacterized protein (UPF0335 family)